MLTKDQQEAFNSIFQFIADHNEHVFVLEGLQVRAKVI